jgi:hypothetical protein
MTSEERDLITGLFNRLQSADVQQHDAEADNLIRQLVASQPAAPYQIVQTLLVQEHALLNAQARIKALEQQLAAASAQQVRPAPAHSGGFLSGLFGGSSTTPPPAPSNIPPQSLPSVAPPAPPYPSTVNLPASAGGGFLRGALTTAAGVAGGALLFQGVEDLLGHRSGAFGSGLGGGGGFMDTGFGGRPEVVENINNYYGSQDNPGGGGGTDPGLQSGGDFQDTGFDTKPDDFPASVDLGNDASVAAPDDFGASNDSFADTGSDFSGDDGSQT